MQSYNIEYIHLGNGILTNIQRIRLHLRMLRNLRRLNCLFVSVLQLAAAGPHTAYLTQRHATQQTNFMPRSPLSHLHQWKAFST